MGLLVEGTWHDRWYETSHTGGRFVRQKSKFRHWIGNDEDSEFLPEANRYHLYVSLACPWAHRTLIFRTLKGLENVISVSIVDPIMGAQGWGFSQGYGGSGDPVNSASHLHEIYSLAEPGFTGRVTVPTLWDKKKKTIVNNESSEIIRMFNSAFDGVTNPEAQKLDFYPEALRDQIDSINEQIYHDVNNGVYKVGFATTQDAYEEAFSALFDRLDQLEALLGRQRYLVGDQLTEADWRFFTTLIRFDAVYHGHFKCNQRRIADYPNLWEYTRELYQTPGVAETVDLDQIKTHYYASHESINPTRIVPRGPLIDFEKPHRRDRLPRRAA